MGSNPISKLKRKCLLVSTARGELIDQDVLLEHQVLLVQHFLIRLTLNRQGAMTH